MATSYNGWPASPDPGAIGVDTRFGASVGAPAFGNGGYAGGVKAGDVSTVMAYLVRALHTRVEPMMTDPNTGQTGYGCWGYNYRPNANNPSQLSNHASATAVDFNAPRHPNGSSTGPNGGGGWTGAQYRTIQTILTELGGVIRWLSGNDPMHFEIRGDAAAVAAVAATLGDATVPPTVPPVDPPAPAPPATFLQELFGLTPKG